MHFVDPYNFNSKHFSPKRILFKIWPEMYVGSQNEI
jgi:hypothetical protein